jgi:hypothetical protein|tara:strand:- start:643 stop:939 length:297 start_codon:yes stop_codon:yes gene_type:complete
VIKETKLLSDNDWVCLAGNDLYVSMLRNKVKLHDDKSKDEAYTDVVDYLEFGTEGLCYYKAENIYGTVKYDVYFEQAIDKDNFISFYSTSRGLDIIKK